MVYISHCLSSVAKNAHLPAWPWYCEHFAFSCCVVHPLPFTRAVVSCASLYPSLLGETSQKWKEGPLMFIEVSFPIEWKTFVAFSPCLCRYLRFICFFYCPNIQARNKTEGTLLHTEKETRLEKWYTLLMTNFICRTPKWLWEYVTGKSSNAVSSKHL
jgi:hypothetical protein